MAISNADVPECNNCENKMQPAQVRGALVAWYCVPCRRLRPHYAGTTVNDENVRDKEK